MKYIDTEMAYHYAKELEMDAMFDGTSKQNLARAYLQLLDDHRYTVDKLTGQVAQLHELARLQAARLVSERLPMNDTAQLYTSEQQTAHREVEFLSKSAETIKWLESTNLLIHQVPSYTDEFRERMSQMIGHAIECIKKCNQP